MTIARTIVPRSTRGIALIGAVRLLSAGVVVNPLGPRPRDRDDAPP